MKIRPLVAVILSALLVTRIGVVAFGQEVSSARDDFDQVFSQWKEVVDGMRKLQLEAEVTEDEQLASLKEQYAALVMKGNGLLPQLRDAAAKAYQAAQTKTGRSPAGWSL